MFGSDEKGRNITAPKRERFQLPSSDLRIIPICNAQARSGTLREKVTETKLCELLEEDGKTKQTKVSIQRRVVKGFDDDDDDDDSDMM